MRGAAFASIGPDYFDDHGCEGARGTQHSPTATGTADRGWVWSTRRWPGSTGQAVRWVGAFASTPVPGSRSSASSATPSTAASASPIDPEFYQPYRQAPWTFMTVVIRSTLPAAELTANLERQLASIDCPRDAAGPLDVRSLVSGSVALDRFEMSGLVMFAGLALRAREHRPLRGDGSPRRSAEQGARAPHGAGREPGDPSCERFCSTGWGWWWSASSSDVRWRFCSDPRPATDAVRRHAPADPATFGRGRGDPRHRRAARVRDAGAAGHARRSDDRRSEETRGGQDEERVARAD